MAVKFEFKAPKGAIPKPLKEAVGSLDGSHRQQVYAVAGEHVENIVSAYILKIAPQNHRTAFSFSPAAKPTGHLEKAAQNVSSTASQSGAIVTVASPGITRAFGALNIRSKGKKLTIPARTAPEAYGRRAREVAMVEPLFLVKPKSGRAYLGTRDGGEPTGAKRAKLSKPSKPTRPARTRKPREGDEDAAPRPVFWLRDSVTVPQKRDILPSDRELTAASVGGIARGMQAVLKMYGVPLQ